MSLRHALVALALLGGMAAACQPSQPSAPAAADASPLAVKTTSFPVDWLVRRIGGQRVEAENILPPGEDPPFWQPPGAVVAGLASADLIVANGATFEKWMATASLPRARVVETSRGLDLIQLPGITHSHGAGGAHSHVGTDPHTWSDPELFALQAAAVGRALTEADPGGAAEYEAALGRLRADLEALSASYRQVLHPPEGLRLAASHPAFNYLARRYGLEIRSFGFEPSEAPDEAALAELSAWAAGEGPVALLWEAPPSDAARAAFPPQVRHVYIDPLEQPPEGGAYDYLGQARANVARFKELFGE